MNETQARTLAAEVLAGIAPEANLDTVDDDEDLRQALDLDSMDFMNFVIGLSERSRVNIPESDTPRLRTIRGVVTYLAAHASG